MPSLTHLPMLRHGHDVREALLEVLNAHAAAIRESPDGEIDAQSPAGQKLHRQLRRFTAVLATELDLLEERLTH